MLGVCSAPCYVNTLRKWILLFPPRPRLLSTPQPTTIDGVVRVLDEIIDECVREESRLGYFAALYRRVTVGVRRRVENGTYADGPRMEQLDVCFAQRYIDAYFQYRRDERPTEAWAYTFEAGQDEQPIVLQHLLLGMNAHINLDLPIASARILDEHDPTELEADFHAVNNLLGTLIDEIQDEISTAGTWMKVVDVLGGPVDEALCSVFLSRARSGAWRRAQKLHDVDSEKWAYLIQRYDYDTLRMAQRIYAPDSSMRRLRHGLRRAESDDVRAVIEAMR